MILHQVQNFDNFPDGRLRVGPFPGTPAQIARSLSRHGLELGAQGERGACSRVIDGIMVSAAGEGVTGYLLDATGLEAASSDLESFLEDVLRPGVQFTIEGHHCLDETRMVRSTLSAWISEGGLMLSGERVLHSAGGRRRTLSQQVPTSMPQAASAGAARLSLVV